MLHKFFSRSAFLVVALASVLAHANDGNNGIVTLSGAYTLWSNTYSNNTVRIVVASGDYYNPSSCSNLDSYMVSSSISAEARQRIYSTLLAAKLAGKAVKLNVDNGGCEGDGPTHQDRPRVLNVMID